LLHGTVVTKDIFSLQARIEFLLDRGISPNHNDKDFGFGTALHLAIANEGWNDKESQFVAKILIRKFQDSKYQYNWNITDDEGKTPLALAAKVRSNELVKMILEVKRGGADIDVNKVDKYGRSPLHLSSALGDNTSVEALLEAGADINLKDKYDRTPLHYAVMREELVRNLLEEIHIYPDRDEYALRNHLLDIENQPVCLKTQTGSDLITAVKKSLDIAIPLILKQFEQMRFTSKELKDFYTNFIKIQSDRLTGKSLIQACMEGHIEVVETLVKNRANLNIKNGAGNTPYELVKRDSGCSEEQVVSLERIIARKIKVFMDNLIKESQELGQSGEINAKQSNLLSCCMPSIKSIIAVIIPFSQMQRMSGHARYSPIFSNNDIILKIFYYTLEEDKLPDVTLESLKPLAALLKGFTEQRYITSVNQQSILGGVFN
jgi:ankyrin repeat protein